MVHELSERDISYLAGLVDGEGSVSLFTRGQAEKGYVTPSLQITNCDRRLIDWLHENLGGQVYEQKPRSRRRPCWLWCCFGKVARDIIKRVEPSLIVKGEQARVVLRLGEPGCRNSLSDEEREQRYAAIAEMRDLNRRGTADAAR